MTALLSLLVILSVFALLFVADQIWMSIVGTPIDHHSRMYGERRNKKGK